MTEPGASSSARPALSVLRGSPTPDELAALLVVLARRPPAHRSGARRPDSLWSSRSRTLRAPLFPGAGAWRASGLPG